MTPTWGGNLGAGRHSLGDTGEFGATSPMTLGEFMIVVV